MENQRKEVDKGGRDDSPHARVVDEQTSSKSDSVPPPRKDVTQVVPDINLESSSGKVLSAKSGEATDLEPLLKYFTHSFQVVPEEQLKESSENKSECAKSGGASAFTALFQAPLDPTEIQPHWREVHELYNRMRKILHNPIYLEGERLSHEDEKAVRGVLKHHPKCEQKTGPGIAYIKIDRIFNYRTRCFWVVHVDGTEIDFSYHKCLKAKAAKECPDLLEQYDSLYRNYKDN